jgi:hypothetical protein
MPLIKQADATYKSDGSNWVSLIVQIWKHAGQTASAQSNRPTAARVSVVSLGKGRQEAPDWRPCGGFRDNDQWSDQGLGILFKKGRQGMLQSSAGMAFKGWPINALAIVDQSSFASIQAKI